MNLKECQILVTATSYGKNDPSLKTFLEERVGRVIYNPLSKPLTSAQLQELLPGVDGWVAGLDEINETALASADRLKVISRYGVGVDNVDLAAARARAICVTNTPGANSVSVAELTIAMMLALARHVPAAVNATRRGEWPRLSGISLEGKTVGILGLGAIGKQLALRLVAFGCRLLAYDPFPAEAFASQNKITLLPMEAVLRESDFISLHLPLLPETRGMVNDAFLSQVKHGAYLINTARGEVVDEAALLRALQSGRLAGVALDAFNQEPPDPSNPLLLLPQVVVTPHMGAHADSAANSMGWMAAEDCLAVLEGRSPKYPVP